MENLSGFALSNLKGQPIILNRLHLTQTYEGLLEGTAKAVSKFIRKSKGEFFASIYLTLKPTLLLTTMNLNCPL